MKTLLTIGMIGLLTAVQTNQEKILFYVGSTDKTGSAAIRLASLDPVSGEISVLETTSSGPSPGYVSLSPDKKSLYVVTGDQKINAYGVGGKGQLTLLNESPSEGQNPCHVSVHPSGSMVYLANYTGGSFTAYRTGKGGALAARAYSEQYHGKGPDARRQEKAHAHCAVPSPDGRFVFVADLGTDKVMNYIVDQKGVKPNPAQPFFSGAPGAGPRHLVVHPSGKWLYLLNELDATVTAAALGKNGVITSVETYKTLPAGYTEGGNTSAAIRLHPNGKFLYVSNRGYDAVHGFRIGADGRLKAVSEAREQISTPRDFNIDPSGRFLIVANLKTHDFAVYTLNQETGALTFKKKTGKVPEPSCIEFL